jgi:ketosteroid isomerase-like protein
MRALAALLCLAAPALSCTRAPAVLTDEEQRAVTAEVREAIIDLRAAMNAQDPQRVSTRYDRSGDFAYVGCTELILGGAEYRRITSPYYSASRSVTFEQEVVHIRALDRHAAVVAMRGSSTRAPHLFWTQVWIKDGSGRWVVGHEHESWPGCREPRGAHPPTAPPGTTGTIR